MTNTQLKALLTLQTKDLTLLQLKKEAQGIPERQERLKDNAASARNAEAAAREAADGCKASIRQVELEVEEQKERINKYKNQQMQAKTNEEYKAFVKEIESAEVRISALEDRELEEMSRLEDLQTVLQQAAARLEEAEAKVASDVKQLDARMEVIRDSFAQVKEEREALAKDVDAEILDRYMNLLTKKQEAVLVPVRQDNCGGCHMKLTPQELHDAHSGQKWTSCSHCGRILYDPAA